MTHNRINPFILGREQDSGKIWKVLEERSVLLVGPRRIGKTELLRSMVQTPRPGFLGVRVDLQGANSVAEAVERILHEMQKRGIAESLGARVEARVSSAGVGPAQIALRDPAHADPWERLGAVLSAARQTLRARTAGEGSTLFLALDEVPWWLDAVQATEGKTEARRALAALRYLRQRDDLRDSLRMILTGSVGLAGLAHGLGASAELNDLTPVYELGPLEPAAGMTLFEMDVTRFRHTTTRDAARRAHEVAGGSPHWIRVLAERSAASLAESEQVDEVAVDEGVEALLAPRMRHLFADEGGEHLVRRYGREKARVLMVVLSEVTRSPGPVPREALINAALAAGVADRGEAGALLHLLVDEFYLGFDSRAGTYSFLLPLLQRWWRWYGESS